jgi:hypothetical protein
MTASPPVRDRRQLLLVSTWFNGIDYVEVIPGQTRLFVHFLNTVALPGSPAVTITGGDLVPSVAVSPVDGTTDWGTDSEGRPVLALTVTAPADFSTYQLAISSDKLDPFFDHAPVNFKANCPTTLDPEAPAPSGQETAAEQVPIDYLAKDFASFRQALSEFSALRYPAWVERSEADLGMVLMEALAATADELSYYQDRVAAESAIGTATQRLSVIRHARLVDYEPAPATAATTVLQLDVSSPPDGTSWTIDTPLLVRGLGADGSVVNFEIEDPAAGIAGPVGFTVDIRWNRDSLVPYYWDGSQRCLPAGSAGFYIQGHDLGLCPGQRLLLDLLTDSCDPPARELVEVSAVEETSDPLGGDPPPVPLTWVLLRAPTTENHDLDDTAIAGNIVPAVHGLRQSEKFTITDPMMPQSGPVIVRAGPNWTPQDPLPSYRYCLASGPLAWLPAAGQEEDSPAHSQPELVLSIVPSAATAEDGTSRWRFKRWLLDAAADDPVFTLTPELYSPVLTSNGVTWFDYDGDGGTTIRFGDGSFGLSPPLHSVFQVDYRVGGGVAGNVPADTIVSVAPGQPQGSIVTSCTNPFPATGGADAETIAQVRDRAPRQLSAKPLRVVRAGDYVAAAQSLPWVQQAGTTFRWTGSWLTVLTSADPAGEDAPTIAQLESLAKLLNQRRLAGYESYVLPPRYLSVDLRITVRGQPASFKSDVTAAVLARLQPGPLPGGAVGFFDHSQWRFGDPLESSALLAAIQSCPGVVGVNQVQYRRLGVLDWAPLPGTLAPAADQILRVDNDASRPEAGSLQVTVEGSK